MGLEKVTGEEVTASGGISDIGSRWKIETIFTLRTPYNWRKKLPYPLFNPALRNLSTLAAH
jgi:hypothetical protein